MRHYVYDPKAFHRHVTFTGVFCLLIAAYSCWMLLSGVGFFWIVLLVSLYQVFNTFISASIPSQVTVGEDTLSFSAYGRTHTYPLDEITSLRIREIDPFKKMYVRVNEATLLKGRYWVTCRDMNDGRELWDVLEYLEYQKEPDQLKFRARIPKDPFAKKEEQENTIDGE